jgi:hypothetical protein
VAADLVEEDLAAAGWEEAAARVAGWAAVDWEAEEGLGLVEVEGLVAADSEAADSGERDSEVVKATVEEAVVDSAAEAAMG